MSIHEHETIRDGIPVRSRLSIQGANARETVWRVGRGGRVELLHEAGFPRSTLCGARLQYLRVLTESVLDAEARACRLGISLADALTGKTRPAAPGAA